jgi:hypothetical protein
MGTKLVKLSDGTVVASRISDKGIPTVDVTIPGLPGLKKFKFP